MNDNASSLLAKVKLKQACKYSNARWAVWLERVGNSWELRSHFGLSKYRQQWLQGFVQEKKNVVWLAGSLSNHRRRQKELGILEDKAGCKYLVLFPASGKHQQLLVGVDSLAKNFDEFWRIISLEPPVDFNVQVFQREEMIQPASSANDLIQKISTQLTHDEVLGLITAVQENTIELAGLALKVQTSLIETPESNLENLIQQLLQQFLHRVRQLLNAPYAQIGWIESKQDTENIPHAFGKQPAIHFQGFLTEIDPERNSAFHLHEESIYPLHYHIATIGESILTNDLSTWMSVSEQQQAASRFGNKYLREDDGMVPKINCQSIVGVPLQFGGVISGSLVLLDDRAEKSFSEKDLFLLNLLIPQLEIAIGYARLNTILEEQISAHKLAESRLVRSARLAAVGEMAAGVAHELNNPLTTVIGFVELVLNEHPSDSASHDDLDLVLSEALRARRIVRGLLDFSRPSQDQRIPSDLNDLISQVLNLVRHMLRMNDVSIRLELWDDLPLVVVDPNKIQQVLQNLMQNAIRSMPNGGTLTIKTSPGQKPTTIVDAANRQWVSFLIQDTGVGIPAEDLGRIFEPFFTHQHSDRIDEPGIGLGLSITYGIIQSHAGVIEVESEVNQGSKFTVFLPLGEQ
jgi:signal transduction histidine kinase